MFQEFEAAIFSDSQHMKVVRLSALGTGCLYPPRNIPRTHFFWRLSRLQNHSAVGRIMTMKNTDDTIGNRTRFRLVAQCLKQLCLNLLVCIVPTLSALVEQCLNQLRFTNSLLYIFYIAPTLPAPVAQCLNQLRLKHLLFYI